MKYYVIDTETTGLKAGYHEVTEISIIRCADLVQKTWNIKIKYPKRVSPQALAATGNTIEELLGRGKYIEEVAEAVEKFLQEDGAKPDERVMIAHNATFDQKMMEAEFALLGKPFPANMWECTMQMSRKFLKQKNPSVSRPKVNQRECITQFGIKSEAKDHASETDARNCYRIRDFLLKNGINELEFITKSKQLVKVAAEKEAASLSDDACMDDVFNFGSDASDDDI